MLRAGSECRQELGVLDVLGGQAREFLEAEFGRPERADANPYEILKEYYATTINELKSQIISYQSTGKKGANLRKFLTVERTREETGNVSREKSQTAEGTHAVVWASDG